MWRVQVASTGTSAPSLWSNPTHAKANAPRGRPRWPNLCRPCTTVVPVLVMRLFPVLQHLRRQPGGHRMLWLPPRPLPPLVALRQLTAFFQICRPVMSLTAELPFCWSSGTSQMLFLQTHSLSL